MKTASLVRSVLVTMLFGAASAGAGESADGQAAAAALLSRPSTSGVTISSVAVRSPVTTPVDGHERAAALLSRPQTFSADDQVAGSPRERKAADGHTKAAALLSRPSTI